MRQNHESSCIHQAARYLVLPFVIFFLAACTSEDSGDSGNSSSTGNCDIVANATGPAFFKVINNLGSGVAWYLPDYAFGADMKPGECTIMGVMSSQYTLEVQQCSISNAACTSYFGQTKYIVFSVLDGETYTLNVTSNTFN
jgi:hypothetical protein